ncbi:MAG: ABC transporter permease [Nitrososphaeria archaeon]|nr:ABC transporter permease [Nitrososphaeria archaeon]MDW8043374.1 ABC transporter permease [Nitrososphaerota archaeon]
MGGLLNYVVRRVLISIPTFFGVSLIVFLMVRLLPGDPARVIAGLLASEEEVQRIRVFLGLDKPIHEQYFIFLSNLIRGDLGTSARTGNPVIVEIASRLPYTFALTLAAMAIAIIIGVLVGVFSARHRYTKADYAITTASLFGVSMPVYWLGIILILVFAVNLRLLPAAGAERPESVVLPALTLALFSSALIVRMTRSSMIEAMSQDYVRTARSKGLEERTVVYKHALRNALIPVVTVVGLQFGNLLGGAVLTETVFAWPGIGRLLYESLMARDYPVIQGVVLMTATIFIVINIIVDIIYSYIDPRIRYD